MQLTYHHFFFNPFISLSIYLSILSLFALLTSCLSLDKMKKKDKVGEGFGKKFLFPEHLSPLQVTMRRSFKGSVS